MVTPLRDYLKETKASPIIYGPDLSRDSYLKRQDIAPNSLRDSENPGMLVDDSVRIETLPDRFKDVSPKADYLDQFGLSRGVTVYDLNKPTSLGDLEKALHDPTKMYSNN